MQIQSIMSRTVLTAEKSMTIRQAAQILAQRKVGCLVVLENGHPVGIVTESDFTRDVVATGMGGHEPLGAIMTNPIYSANPAADVMEVANTMTTQHIKKMPIIENGRVLGIVTQTDVINHLFNAAQVLNRAYSQGKLSEHDFAEKTEALFNSAENAVAGQSKTWHMVCKNCGNRFLNTEDGAGNLQMNACPSCNSPHINYDQSPHL